MNTVTVPTYDQVSPANQAIFDSMKKKFGFVPNLFATFAHSETALATYLALNNSKSSLSPKAREVIYLVVSQVNHCAYCLAAHTAVGQMLGYTPEQVLEIRAGGASFDPRLDALAKLVRNIVLKRGHADAGLVQVFFAVGWTEGNLVDAIVAIGDKMISNFLHATTLVPVDFPAAPPLSC
jgi:uncharacterized peroxidase-related enzyme